MDEREGLILDVTPADGEFDRSFLEKLGHPVLVCHGPEGGHSCPILEGSSCEWVSDAHGIVFQLDLDDPKHRTILKRYQSVVPAETPLIAVIREGQKEKYHDLLQGVRVWEVEPTVSQLDGLAAEVETVDHVADQETHPA
jgi:hypothetical protein